MRFVKDAAEVLASEQNTSGYTFDGDAALVALFQEMLKQPDVEVLKSWKVPLDGNPLRALLAVSLALGTDLDEDTASPSEIRERDWLLNGGAYTSPSPDTVF